MGSGNSAIEKTKSLGNKHFTQGNYKLAVKFYSKALHYDPYNQALLSNRSASYLKLNRPGKALDDALSLLTAAPSWVKSYYRLASALADLGLFREAQYYAKVASALTPGDASIFSLLSTLKSRQILGSDKSSTLEWGYQLRPKAIDALVGIHFADLCVSHRNCGMGHTVAVTDTGEVFVWGENSHQQCGVEAGLTVTEPMLVRTLIGKQASAVACGGGHSLVLCRNGEVYSWGTNGQGQCGLEDPIIPYPTLVPLTFSAKGIAAGFGHTMFLTTSGAVQSCGWNNCGQLGRGLSTPKAVLGVISGLPPVSQVSCGAAHTLLVSESGTLWSTGSNSCGQLGLGHERDESVPVQVQVLSGVAVAACGEEFSSIVTRRYEVYTFGLGNVGQLGDGGTRIATSPIPVTTLTRELGTEILACTKAQVLAVTGSGHVYSWGLIGDTGSVPTVKKPTLVTSLKSRDVRDIRCLRDSFMISLKHASAADSFVTGIGIERVTAGKRVTGVVHLLDRDGMFITAPGERTSACIVDVWTGERVPDSEADCYYENGKYEVTARTRKAGQYHLHVFCNNQVIKSSPLTLTVVAAGVGSCRGSLLVHDIAGSAENVVRPIYRPFTLENM